MSFSRGDGSFVLQSFLSGWTLVAAGGLGAAWAGRTPVALHGVWPTCRSGLCRWPSCPLVTRDAGCPATWLALGPHLLFLFLREARGIFQAENTVCGCVSRTEGARTLVSRLGAGGGRGPRRGPLLSPSLARRLQLSLSLKDVTEGDSRPGADLASVLTGLERVNNSSLRYFWPGTVRPDARLRCRQELPKGWNSHCGEIKDVPAGRNAAEPGDGPGRGHLSSWLREGRARVGGRSRAGRGASCGHLGDDELPCCH